jgi:hypothetical protein
MRIRTIRPLVGDWDPRALVVKAKAEVTSAKQRRLQVDGARAAAGESVRPDEVDTDVVAKWLFEARRSHLQAQAPASAMASTSSSGSSTVGGGSSTEPTPYVHVMRDRVVERIHRFEREEGVRVVFAAECSSRSIGTDHAGSDHDVACIYVHRSERCVHVYGRVRAPLPCSHVLVHAHAHIYAHPNPNQRCAHFVRTSA